MKTKNTKSLAVILTILFILAYIFFAARPLSKEYSFEPVWQIDITSKAGPSDSKTHIPFKLNNSIGYFSEDGTLLSSILFDSRASISDDYYSVYGTSDSKLALYKPDNTQLTTINASGFPYFEEGNIFVFLSGGASFAKYDEQGNQTWIYEGIFPITAFDTTKAFTAVGFSDGKIKLFDNENGSIIMDYEPAGSNYPIILGIAVSNDGQYVASVSGQEDQRFVIAKNENKKSKIIYHEFLDSELTRRTQVYFTKDGKKVIYDANDHAGIYDIEKQKPYSIKIDKKILSVDESENLIFLLGKKDKNYTVYLIEKTNTLEGSFTFNAENAFINVYNEALYVGKDSTISKIAIERN